MRKAGLLAVLLFVMLFSACQDTNAVQKPDSTDGHFEDVTAWNGSVIGTTYENATDEILFTLDALSLRKALRITALWTVSGEKPRLKFPSPALKKETTGSKWKPLKERRKPSSRS